MAENSWICRMPLHIFKKICRKINIYITLYLRWTYATILALF
jgi:hypothetical protein